MTRKL